MRQFLFLLLPALAYVSCRMPKSSGVIKNAQDEEHPHYEHHSPYFEIPVVADYRFHSMNKKNVIDTDESFLKYAGKRLNGKKPRFLYAAHTFVPPFYSTIGLLYLHVQSGNLLNEEIKRLLKTQMNVTVHHLDTVTTNVGSAFRINYTVINRNTKISTCYAEYLINDENNLIRIFFWTRDCGEQVIKEETEGVIKKIALSN